MTENHINDQALKKLLLHKTANWINEQIEHVWYALAGENPLRKEDKTLQIKQNGKETFYYFTLKNSFCAEAKSYFDLEEQQWRFELTQVTKEYYQRIHDYFTDRN